MPINIIKDTHRFQLGYSEHSNVNVHPNATVYLEAHKVPKLD